MSLAIVHSRAALGVRAPGVNVEVHIGPGLPRLKIVGLPEAAVRESESRVRGALHSAGFEFPDGRVTVSLAPADLPKAGSRFDLPIAIGVLRASGQLHDDGELRRVELMGELSLGGCLRGVGGCFAAAVRAARDGRVLLTAYEDAVEAAGVAQVPLLGARTLLDVCAHLDGSELLHAPQPRIAELGTDRGPDLAEVRGQPRARRALEIAAAGEHNLLLRGPPGTGKTMLARRLVGLLPPMSDAECLEAAAVRSLARGRRGDPQADGSNARERAFRAPHHTASAVALIGGGNPPMPGEVSLAHAGVLFLDELPEFGRRTLEVLREPIETGSVAIARAAWRAEFPARFQLVAAMNPCPCGHHGDGSARCRCPASRVDAYAARISGPLLDRIDVHVDTNAAHVDAASPDASAPESTATVARRVERATLRAQQRQGTSNARLEGHALDDACALDPACEALISAAERRWHLSSRGRIRVMRVARTIADLAGDEGVGEAAIAEAIAFRTMT